MTFYLEIQTWSLRSTVTFQIKIKTLNSYKVQTKMDILKMSGSLLKCAAPQRLILTWEVIISNPKTSMAPLLWPNCRPCCRVTCLWGTRRVTLQVSDFPAQTTLASSILKLISTHCKFEDFILRSEDCSTTSFLTYDI